MTDMLALMRKNNWSLHCDLCGKNVFEDPLDYFALKDEVWDQVTDNDYISDSSVLCRDCVEQILGRKLQNEDFADAPVNYEYDDDTRILKNEIYKLGENAMKIVRNLDNIYFRVKRGNSCENLCFTDLTEDERLEVLKEKSPEFILQLSLLLAKRLREVGDQLGLKCE